MQPEPGPHWRFAPTAGGYEQASSAGQFHFADQAYTKMVREILQNSLDNPENGLGPVTVNFRLIYLQPQDIFQQTLLPHVQAANRELQPDADPDTRAHYARMEKLLSAAAVPTLAITDSNTTGLSPDKWKNLIFREGARVNDPSQARGGSFGFGKNAPFNLSDLNTVIYSTRYVSRAANGRFSAIAGKCQLITHPNPENPEERLQHIGFLCQHHPKPNQPIEGTAVPQPYALKAPGTGVFIAGFDPDQHHDWPKRTQSTAVRNFFAAIDQNLLVVNIEAPDGRTETLDQHSLSAAIEELPARNPTRHYYHALHQQKQLTDPNGRLSNDKIDRLELRITLHPDAPRRLAHLNRRGMLITDSRETADNPLRPYGGTTWSPWAAVSVAHDDASDRFIRRLEPPAHDAIRPNQLRDRNDQDFAKIELRRQQEQLAKLIKDALEQHHHNQAANITELAQLFPHLILGGANLHPSETVSRVNPDQPVDTDPLNQEFVVTRHGPDTDDDDDTASTTDADADRSNADPPATTGESDADRPNRPDATLLPAAARIKNLRIIRVAPDQLALTLRTPTEPADSLTYGIRTAGEQYLKQEPLLRLTTVSQPTDLTASAELEDQRITVRAPPQTRVDLRIGLAVPDQRHDSYRLTVSQDPEQPARNQTT